jgi:hypothetical protein
MEVGVQVPSMAHEPSIELQVCSPIWPARQRGVPVPASRHCEHTTAVVQLPPAGRLHARVSVRGAFGTQLPVTHIAGPMQVRLCVPASAHSAIEVTVHVPHAPHVSGTPHEVPSVSRMHERVSVDIIAMHAPVAQRGVVIVRDCVPVSSHPSVNPPQAPKPVIVGVPQLTPSVSRTQPVESISVRIMGVQAPATHVELVMTRERVPDSPHASGKLHEVHPPSTSGAQPSPSVSREHASVSSRIAGVHVPPAPQV